LVGCSISPTALSQNGETSSSLQGHHHHFLA
jgi:hypothetical protein